LLALERTKAIAASNAGRPAALTDESEPGLAPTQEELAAMAAHSPAGQIAALVRNNPRESIATIRSWLSQTQDA
jgi:hypothetical protein